MKTAWTLLPLLRRYRTLYLIAIAALIASTVVVLTLPQKVGEFFQVISGDTTRISVAAMMRPGVQIVGLAMAQAILAGIYGYLIAIAAERIGNELRSRFFANLLAQPLVSEKSHRSGEIASEFISDLSIIQSGVGDTLIAFLRHVLFTAGALVAMFVVDARMALVTLGSAGAVAALSIVMIRLATRALIATQSERAQVIGALLEAANNRYVIEAFSRGAYFRRRFDTQLGQLFQRVRGYQRLMAIINPVIFVFLALAALAVLATGVGEIHAGRLQTSHLVAFVTYVLILIAAIMHAGTTAGALMQAGAMYAKHQALLRPPTAGVEDPGASAGLVRHVPIGFRFEDVRFRYPGTPSDILAGVSFTIPAGKTTALIGESGAGKSTISSLLLGLLHANSGRVERMGAADSATGAIAVVPQHPFLFTGTVADNIGFGRGAVDAAAVSRAAGLAHIASFIRSLPDGYDHLLNESGGNLSRGQQQRIALARALATAPGTLILDEATASLDSASERAIAASLRETKGERTIFIIAHKGELLNQVDHLIVLKDGVVAYEGPPERYAGEGAIQVSQGVAA